MISVKITTTPAFLKSAEKLPPNRKKKLIATLAKFLREPKLPSLDFRRLQGAPGYFIIDSTGGDRIILRKIGEDEYEAVDAGVHDIYRRLKR